MQALPVVEDLQVLDTMQVPSLIQRLEIAALDAAALNVLAKALHQRIIIEGSPFPLMVIAIPCSSKASRHSVLSYLLDIARTGCSDSTRAKQSRSLVCQRFTLVVPTHCIFDRSLSL